ncbi:MAG: chemotaxis protein CheW [Polyangiaceae bacterium]|jgi:chemotaxis signal transduction protein
MAEQLVNTHDQGATKEESQLVTFYLGDEEFGFDIMSVQEIIRQPVLCRVPMAPEYVEGIANLRGTVLPVIDTRTRFGMKREADTDGTRVLVVDIHGQKTGLRVDRVRQVTRIQAAEMEAPPQVLGGGGHTDYLRNVAKLEGGKRIIMELNPRTLCEIHGQARSDAPDGDRSRTTPSGEAASADAGSDQSIVQLVSFTLGGEEYSFPMEQVREILRVERPNVVPNAANYVLGILTVRGKILPVIDLRVLLGLRTLAADITTESTRLHQRFEGWLRAKTAHAQHTAAADPGLGPVEDLHAWIAGFTTSSEKLLETLGSLRVVTDKVLRACQSTTTQAASAVAGSAEGGQFTLEVAPNASEALRLLAEFNQQVEENISEDQRLVVVQANGTLLALLVDRVREVLNVPKGLIDPPSRISSTDRREMAGVARLNEGKRLILLLDTASLIEGNTLDSLKRAAEGPDMQTTEVATDQQVRREQSLGERQFVTFRLADGEYGIPIDQIQEIDRPAAMTRIPKAASYVEGITNLRGEVIPVINARKRFSLPAREVDEQARVIIIDVKGKKTGLLVDSVREVRNQAIRDIAPPPAQVSEGVGQEFISGIGKAADGKRMIVLLDVTKILEG